MGIDVESMRRWAGVLTARTRLSVEGLQDALVSSDFIKTDLDFRRVHLVKAVDGSEVRISGELCLQGVRYLSMLQQREAWDSRYTAREVWNLLGKGEEVEEISVPPLAGEVIEMNPVTAEGIVDEVLEEERVQEYAWRSAVYKQQLQGRK